MFLIKPNQNTFKNRPTGVTLGVTLIEIIITIAILIILTYGIYGMFNFAFKILDENKKRTGAVAVANQQLEVIRNLPYDDIGVIGGAPAGTLDPIKEITLNNVIYDVTTEIIYIDDPFDGIGADDENTLTNDYKKVRISVAWQTMRSSTQAVILTGNIASKGMESDIGGGTLDILVFNAEGQVVAQADIHIINTEVIPSIDINTQTNDSGQHYRPGLPPSENSYQISVTKTGYSADQTYPIIEEMPNPLKPHASIREGGVTPVSFAIDLVSTLNIKTISQAIQDEWKINTDESEEDQTNVAFTIDNSDNFIFGWQDYKDTSNSKIYSQIYDDTKTQQWADDVRISSANKQINPKVTTDVDGNLYYIWNDDSNGNQDIYLLKIDPTDGSPVWTGSKKVNTDATSTDQTFPDIAVFDANIYVIWQDNRDDDGDIYMNKLDLGGNYIWPSEIKINSDATTTKQELPHITIDENENIFVLWLDERAGTENDIYIQKLNSGGSNQWPSDFKVNSDDDNDARQLEAAITTKTIDVDNTLIYVTWADNRDGDNDIYLQILNQDGATTILTDKRINTNDIYDQINPSIALDSDGNYYIAWQGNQDGDYNIYVQKFDSANIAQFDLERKININTPINTNQQKPKILIDSTGIPVVAWEDNRNGNFDIYAARITDLTQTILISIPLTITGEKLISEEPEVFKYQQNHSTDVSGELSLTNMEWDFYGIELQVGSGYNILSASPSLPIDLRPDSTADVVMYLEED